MESEKKFTEKNSTNLIKQKEENDKKLLFLEIVLLLVAALPLLLCVVLTLIIESYIKEDWIKSVIILASIVPILVAIPFAIRIEQTAGYYKCSKCGYAYVPKYGSVFLALQINRTRLMRCPKCNKISWQKKVITKE